MQSMDEKFFVYTFVENTKKWKEKFTNSGSVSSKCEQLVANSINFQDPVKFTRNYSDLITKRCSTCNPI